MIGLQKWKSVDYETLIMLFLIRKIRDQKCQVKKTQKKIKSSEFCKADQDRKYEYWKWFYPLM